MEHSYRPSQCAGNHQTIRQRLSDQRTAVHLWLNLTYSFSFFVATTLSSSQIIFWAIPFFQTTEKILQDLSYESPVSSSGCEWWGLFCHFQYASSASWEYHDHRRSFHGWCSLSFSVDLPICFLFPLMQRLELPLSRGRNSRQINSCITPLMIHLIR